MLRKSTQFKFLKDDIHYCMRIGAERYHKDKAKGIREQRYVSQKKKSAMDLDVFGVVGEYAMTRLLNQSTQMLNDTTPQGIRQDRGDLIIDGVKIDTKCSVGNHVDMWVRENSLRNPSHVYALLTYERVNPLKMPAEYQDDFCSLHENEDLIITFQGAACASDVFQSQYKQIIRGDAKYVYPKEKLLDLQDAIEQYKKLSDRDKDFLNRHNKKNACFF